MGVPQLRKLLVQTAPAASSKGALHASLLEAEAVEEEPQPVCSRARNALRCATAWLVSSVRRFARIVPSVAVLYLLHTYLLPPLFAEGPQAYYWPRVTAGCKTDGAWWRTLLLIGNYATGSPTPDQGFGVLPPCLPHLWYLDVDFQLFVALVIPLCALYAMSAKAGLVAACASFLVFFCTCFAAAYQYKLFWILPPASPNLTGDYNAHYYTVPWTRGTAFAAGMILGFCLLQYEHTSDKGREPDVQPSTQLQLVGMGGDRADLAPDTEMSFTIKGMATNDCETVSWNALWVHLLPSRPVSASQPGQVPTRAIDVLSCIALAVLLLTFGLLFYLPSLAFNGAFQGGILPSCPDCKAWSDDALMFWTAASHPLWSIAISGLLYLCATGRGGLISLCLGQTAWRPLARLSYWVYLIHFDVLYVTDFSVTQLFRFGKVSLALNYAGIVTLSVIAAALLHLIVEMPAAALERAAFRRPAGKSA